MNVEIRFEIDDQLWFVGWDQVQWAALTDDQRQTIESAIDDLNNVY